MVNDKRQKLFGVVFGIAALALVTDRLFILPQGAHAQEESSEESMTSALVVNNMDALQVPEKTHCITERLHTLCSSERILAGDLPDAFSLPAIWLADVDPNGSLMGRTDRVAEFKSRYELLAVAGSKDSPSAFINHHHLQVGQTLHGFTLVAVDDRSATFESDELRFILFLKSKQ